MTRVIFISDVHVGSNYAIFPPDFKNPEDGSPVPPNQWQKKLYQEWEKLADKLSPADVIILMGDLVEGQQTREKFGTLKLQNIQHQAEAFIHLFQSTWKWRKLYVIRGTNYHVATNGLHAEEYIARRLGAERLDEDKFSAIDLLLKIAGKTVSAAHHIGVSQVPHYRFTPLAREMWLGKLFDDYWQKVDLVARGHVHYYIHATVEDIMQAFTCPCWQLPTPYQRKRTVFGSNPSIGLVEATVSPDELLVRAHLVHGFRPRTIEVKKENEA